MKAGCPVVVMSQQDSVAQVLRNCFVEVNHAEESYKNLTEQERDGCPEFLEFVKELGFYEVSREDLEYADTFPRKMCGSFQLENAATAILAARRMFQKWCIEGQMENYIREGIAQTFWKGRMEIINEKPFLMIDGAHNAHGVHALAESLRKLYPNEQFHFIMGVMADKDYEEMIDELLPLAVDFVTVTPESNRALQAKDLAECISKKGISASYRDDLEETIRPYLPGVDKQIETKHKTVAFGSLYFIGAIEALVQRYTS